MTAYSSKTIRSFVPVLPGRRHLAPVAGWTALCILFFATLLLGLEHLPPGDFTGQFHAYALFQARELADGNFPVWSPGSNGGFPFAADVQSAAFYPPRLLAVLLSLPWGFSLYVLQVEAIFHIWLAGLFTYSVAFNLTNSRRAALAGAIAFALGGYLTSYPLLQLAILEAVTWLPLVLVFLWHASRRERPVFWLIAAGLALAISALAGHPQTFMHVAYLAALYYVFRTVRARWTLRWILLGGAIVFVTAVGASAALWLPAAQFASYSTRASVSYEFIAAGQVLHNYLQVFAPRLFTLWSPEYVGLGTVLLALFAWFGRGLIEKDEEYLQLPGGRAEIVFWAAVGVVAAWLALGEEGIVFRLFYRAVPGFSLFRQQERLLGAVSLSWALLAAQGFVLWLRVARSRRRDLVRKTTIVGLLGLLLSGVFLWASPLAEPASDAPVWARQLAIMALTLLLLWRGRGQRLAPFALLLLLGADLYWATDASIDRQSGAVFDYWQKPAWLALLERDQQDGLLGRIDSGNQFQANVGEVYGLEDVRGISPLRLEVTDAISTLPDWRRWQLLGVEHAISTVPLPEPASLLAAVDQPLEPGRNVDAELYRVSGGAGRAWLSYQPVRVAGPEEALEYLARSDFDANREVVLHTPVAEVDDVEGPAGPLPVAGQAVVVTRIEANALQIDVTTASPALLVISEWRYPGWRATVDGNPAPLYPANYAFQTLTVPAGQHTVELRFVPVMVLAGILVSALTVAAVLVVARMWQPVVNVQAEGWQRSRPLPIPPRVPLNFDSALSGLSSFAAANARLLVLGMVFLGVALRLFDLGVQELRGDEAFSFLIATHPLTAVVRELIMIADPHPPLHYLLLSGWLRLAGDSEFAMRYVPALGSVLILPLIYQMGKQIWSKKMGLLLGLSVAISQSQIWLAQDVRSQYVLALLFTTLATLLLVRVLRRPAISLWALYALVAVLAMYSHLYGMFALLAHGVYVLGSGRRRLAAWALAGLAAFLLYVPWLLASTGGWFQQLADPGPTDLASYLLVVGGELLAGPTMSQGVGPWPILGAALICAAGWLSLWRQRRPWALMLGSWLALAALGIFLVQMHRATFNPFYISVAAPAWWALFIAGLASLARSTTGANSWRKAGVVLILLAVVAINALALAHYWDDPYGYGRSRGYRQMAAHVGANVQDGDVFVANFPDPSLTYYLRNISIPFQLEPERQNAPDAQVEGELRSLASVYRRLWFVPVHASIWDPQEVVFRWVDYHLLLEGRHTFEAVTLESYRPLHAAGEVLWPWGNVINDQLQLEGAYLTVNGLPAALGAVPVTVPGGAELDVSLLWKAADEIDGNYTVFVHLLGPDGQLVAQHDGIPAHGTRPTETWKTGESILDEHLLVAPEDPAVSEGVLLVGLYDSATGQRQQFDNGLESLILAQMQIGPVPPTPGTTTP